MTLGRFVMGASAVVLLLGGGYLLREATESTHYETGAETQLRVVVQASSNRAEPGQSLANVAAAHIAICRLEVQTRQVGAIEALHPEGRFSVTLQPALDSTDRKQYRGCLEDWVVDHHSLHVVSMTNIGGP